MSKKLFEGFDTAAVAIASLLAPLLFRLFPLLLSTGGEIVFLFFAWHLLALCLGFDEESYVLCE